MVAIPVPKRIHILGLVASDLAVGDAGLGLLGAAGCARGETPALVETVGTHEAAQRRIGRHRLEIRLRLGQRDEIVVMQLDAPALVGGVLREHRAADGIADRVLLPSIAAHLAPEHADRIDALSDRTVIPALDSGEAESHGLARRRMLPRSLCQIGDCRPQLALLRRRRQQPADDGKAQVGPLLVNTLMTLATSAVRHDGAPRKRDAPKRSTAAVCSRRASSAGVARPSSSLYCGASCDGTEEAQQRDQRLGAITGEALDQRHRKSIVIDRWHELGTRDPPERRRRERVAPPVAPACDRAAVDAGDIRKPRQTGVGRAVLQDGDQHDDRRDIDAAAEKAQRRWRLPAPAAVDGAAEAEALVVLGAELATAAPGLALELGRMQHTVAMPASPGACGVGEIGVEGEEQFADDLCNDDPTDASNAVLALIHDGKLDEAEAAARALLAQYPDVHDGWDRLGMVHEKRGENRQAADCYRKVVAFLDENLDYSEPALKDAFVARIAKLDPPATG